MPKPAPERTATKVSIQFGSDAILVRLHPFRADKSRLKQIDFPRAFDVAVPEPAERELPEHALVAAEHADLQKILRSMIRPRRTFFQLLISGDTGTFSRFFPAH